MRVSQARWKVLHPSLLVALGAAVAACGGREPLKDPASPEGALPVASVAAPAGAPSSSASAPPAAGVVTEQRFCAIIDALGVKLEGTIDAALRRKDVTPEELEELMSRLTPEGARADLAEIIAAAGLRPEDIAEFVGKEKDAAGRCAERLGAHLEAAFKKVEPALEQARKPQIAWRADVGPARADAVKQKKPTLVVFCAVWAAACSDMDKTTFRDASVRALLTQDVVPVRVDATDEDAASVKKVLKEYKVLGLPTLVIFDAQGRERQRFLERKDGATLAAALRDVVKAR